MIAHSTVDGFALAVQLSGRADAPVLLLLPGQANSHRWWDDLRRDFGHEFRVVTFDYRGTGDSRGPVAEWTTASFARDAADVLAAVGAASASVYGTSMGGRVGQLLALGHPERVEGLVLACTSPGGRHALERSMSVRRALADGDDERRRQVLRELFYTQAWSHPTTHSLLLGDATMTVAETRAHLRVSAKHDAWDRLPSITAPTLVLHGTDDLMVPTANAPLLVERIPQARLALTPGGRHGFFDEFRETVAPAVTAFLHDVAPT